MKKRILALVLGLVMMTSGLYGCAGESKDTKEESKGEESGDGTEETTLTVWCWDENFNIPAMETAGKYYQAAGHENVKFDVMNVSEDDVRTKCIAAFSGGVTEDLPDIILVGDFWAKNFLTSYKGMFADLTDAIDFNDFANYKVQCLTVEDRVYGVPFDSGTAGIFYRTDYLEQAGYSAEDMVDITWPEMIEIAKAVREKTGKYAFDFLPSECAFAWFDSAMQSTGEWFYDEEGNADFVNNKAVREMFDVVKELWNSDCVYRAASRDSAAVSAIQEGEVAFCLTAVWGSSTITAGTDASGLWDYVPVPKLTTTDSASEYTNMGGSSWVVLENSANKDVAVDFMKTIFAGNLDFYDQILAEQGAVATYLPASESEAYNQPVEFFNNKPLYADFASWGANVPAVDYGTNTWTANAAIQAYLQNYIDSEMTLDEALEKVQENYDEQVGK